MFFGLCFFVVTQFAVAGGPERDFNRLTIIITTASYCAPCKMLDMALREAGQYETVSVALPTGAMYLPLHHLSVQTDRERLREFGIFGQESPIFFAFWDRSLLLQSAFNSLDVAAVRTLAERAIARIPQTSSDVASAHLPAATARRLGSRSVQVTYLGTGSGPEKSPIFVGYAILTIERALKTA
jgi:hypothetical protein